MIPTSSNAYLAGQSPNHIEYRDWGSINVPIPEAETRSTGSDTLRQTRFIKPFSAAYSIV